jgi:serine/threonine protein kinase
LAGPVPASGLEARFIDPLVELMSSVFCPKCGKPNHEFSSRCFECGAALPYASEQISAEHLSGEQAPADGPDAAQAEAVTEKLAAQEDDSLVGRSVSHYQVLERLGAGGMGVVYRATDTVLRRTVALKFLSSKLGQSPSAKARLMREAHAASALDDSNIGTVYEVGEHDGQLFIAMAFYEGQTLQERIQQGGPLPVPEAESVLTQLASALCAAHGAGIVHRDLKPANVVLTRSGQVKLLADRE